jgi:PhoH-like ATPase
LIYSSHFLIEVFMPLPKMPTKPAALLSPKDYPKAESGKPSKAVKVAHTEKTRAAENQAATAKKRRHLLPPKAGPRSTQKTAPAKVTRIPAPAPAAAKIATPATTAVTEAKFLISALNRVSAVLPTNQNHQAIWHSIPMS